MHDLHRDEIGLCSPVECVHACRYLRGNERTISANNRELEQRVVGTFELYVDEVFFDVCNFFSLLVYWNQDLLFIIFSLLLFPFLVSFFIQISSCFLVNVYKTS